MFKKYTSFIITTIVFSLFMTLGTWQVIRLKWKNNIVQELDKTMKMAVVEVNQTSNIGKYLYRKIKLTGKFLNDKEIHLYGGSRVLRGEAGYLIITPFELENKEHIIVNRGWVPAKLKEAKARPDTIIMGEVSIEGMVLPLEKKALFTPNNDLNKNMWFWLNFADIKKIIPDVPEYYILAKDNKDNILPVGRDITKHTLRNDHKLYAITWFSLGFIMMIMFYLNYVSKK